MFDLHELEDGTVAADQPLDNVEVIEESKAKVANTPRVIILPSEKQEWVQYNLCITKAIKALRFYCLGITYILGICFFKFGLTYYIRNFFRPPDVDDVDNSQFGVPSSSSRSNENFGIG